MRTKSVCLPKSFSQHVEQLLKAFYVSKAFSNRCYIDSISRNYFHKMSKENIEQFFDIKSDFTYLRKQRRRARLRGEVNLMKWDFLLRKLIKMNSQINFHY